MITENDRLDLRQKLDEVLGARLSEIAMEAMPPLNYDQFATKQDVANLGIELRGEIAGLRGEIGGLHGEIGGLRGDMALMESGLRSDMAVLSTDIGKQFRQYFFANVAIMLTMLGFVVSLG